MMSRHRLGNFSGTLLFLVGTIATGLAQNELTEEQRFKIAVEAVSRLEATDIKNNPEFKAALARLLEKARGTPKFVDLVKQLNQKNQEEGLLVVARKFPDQDAGVEAIRMILTGNVSIVKTALRDQPDLPLIEVLGNSRKKEAVELLLPIVTDEKREFALRRQAVKSLAQISEGAQGLLDLAKKEALLPDLKMVASTELNQVRWDKIKEEARKILPLMESQDRKPLPASSELLAMKGDAANGETVFFRADNGCAKCHQIKGQGTEVGPALTEIGSKLGKDALLDSILNPSAGISFGFEGHQIELKSGEEAYGLIVSETEKEIAVKDLNGIVTRYSKKDVASRNQLKTSIMPSDLEHTMSSQELVDLVEFLFSLKKLN